MLRTFIIALLICHISLQVNSQVDEGPHMYKHANEIGGGIGYVNTIAEEKPGLGLHVHYMRYFGENRRLSIAPGFEAVLDRHNHISWNLALGFRPLHRLYTAVAPGVSFEGEGNGRFITHFELIYEFEVGRVHLGPMIEYGVGRDERHVMLAAHLGYGF